MLTRLAREKEGGGQEISNIAVVRASREGKIVFHLLELLSSTEQKKVL